MTITGLTVVSRGSNVSLFCSSSGGPGNMYQWFKGNTSLVNEDNTMLQLLEVNSTDGGDYTCQVTNVAGMSSSTVDLYIEPYITSFPLTLLVVERTDSAAFACMADGFPFPNISWWKIEGYSVSPESNISVFSGNTLMFPFVTHEDRGTYVCVASAQTPNGLQLRIATTPGSVLIGMYLKLPMRIHLRFNIIP